MDIIQENIRALRKQKGWTQQEMADVLKIKRSSLGAYEEGRARPALEIQKEIAKIFGISLDDLLTKNLYGSFSEKNPVQKNGQADAKGKNLRVLSITVDSDNNENIELIAQKAAAGYLNGYADPEFIREQPKFHLPFLPPGTYRAFEITGDSMLPLLPGSIVVGEYVADWTGLKEGQTGIVLTRNEGVVYKRVFFTEGKFGLTLRSDNPSYPPLNVPFDDVMEVWKARLFITHTAQDNIMTVDRMMQMITELRQGIPVSNAR